MMQPNIDDVLSGTTAHIFNLAECLDDVDEIELGPTDAALCAEALRYMLAHRGDVNSFTRRRADIEHALAAPADAFERHEQLAAAVALDGVESPLAALAARRFAEAIVEPPQ